MISVTVTGADDLVDPRELFALSQDFRFVEWGLLISGKRSGEPRYPSPDWVRAALRGATHGVAFSAHLCGAHARALAAGDSTAIPSPNFERVQVNGYESSQLVGIAAGLARFAVWGSPEVILQCREEATLQEVCRDAQRLEERMRARASVLFDPSGGRGLEPFSWPRTPSGTKVGFAGGIKPSTVEEVIGRIYADGDFIRGDFWIDLETGVRDLQDRFDLSLVRDVLFKVAKINARLSSSHPAPCSCPPAKLRKRGSRG